MKEYKVM